MTRFRGAVDGKVVRKAKRKLHLLKRTGEKKVAAKIHKNTTFRRPRTLRLPKKPVVLRRSVEKTKALDRYQVIRYPLNTEAAHKIMESANTLTFVVDVRATKAQIVDALKKLYNVKAQRVNTLIRPDGQKKAFVRLTPAAVAVDIATQIGIA